MTEAEGFLKNYVENQAERWSQKSLRRSRRWTVLRETVFSRFQRKCMACGRSRTKLHIDHIKPVSRYPHLAMHLDNLQILCRRCNLKKSNSHETDYRPNAKSESLAVF
jgi:5-methylcytosine-specific restriction endonuclease McrA